MALHGGSATKFQAINQARWKLEAEIHLCPSGKYECHSDDFHEPESCSITL